MYVCMYIAALKRVVKIKYTMHQTSVYNRAIASQEICNSAARVYQLDWLSRVDSRDLLVGMGTDTAALTSDEDIRISDPLPLDGPPPVSLILPV